jgi:hypothetical protein
MVTGCVGEFEMALVTITMEDYSTVKEWNNDSGVGALKGVCVT